MLIRLTTWLLLHLQIKTIDFFDNFSFALKSFDNIISFPKTEMLTQIILVNVSF